MKEIISRKEAKVLGLTHYFTGKPCSRGHLSLRYVTTCQCVECLNKWQIENADKKKEYGQRWRDRNPDYIKTWKQENPNWYSEWIEENTCTSQN